MLVCDLRPGGEALVTLSGLQRLLYELCDTACPLATLQQKAGEAASTVVSAAELEALFDPLLEAGPDGARGHVVPEPGHSRRRILARCGRPPEAAASACRVGSLSAPRAPAIPCVSQNGPLLPGLDLAVIRGVTLSLREDASLVEAGENGLAITGPHARFRMNGLSPGLRAAWRQLAAGGASEEDLGDRVFATDGLVERALLRVQLQRCDTLGLLQYALVADARPLAIFVPMRRGFHFSAEPVGLDARFRLSRFAYCRRVGQTLMIESPLSAARTILPDGTGAALLAELATPRTCRDLCARSQTTNRAELHEETAQALLTLLSGAGVIAEVDGDGRLREDLDPALVQWEFHDLLFHSRSRLGRHEYAFGGVFPFLGQIPPLPAVKPSISSEIVPLHKPDLALLEQRDPPLSSVLESRSVSSRVRHRAHRRSGGWRVPLSDGARTAHQGTGCVARMALPGQQPALSQRRRRVRPRAVRDGGPVHRSRVGHLSLRSRRPSTPPTGRTHRQCREALARRTTRRSSPLLPTGRYHPRFTVPAALLEIPRHGLCHDAEERGRAVPNDVPGGDGDGPCAMRAWRRRFRALLRGGGRKQLGGILGR